jgi:protease-4
MNDPWTENPEQQDELEQAVNNDNQAWRTIENVLMASTLEMKRQRRWSLFFRFLYVALFVVFIAVVSSAGSLGDSPEVNANREHMALVSVQGVIADNAQASSGLLIQALENAFKASSAQAVVLDIDSPGGSPVQSRYVYDAIMSLKQRYPNKTVYAVIRDTGASGAYYIAAAADYIYADASSLVGSIGVTAAGFGYVELLEKLGIERRKYTSGENKGFLDAFSPANETEVEHWQSVLNNVHEQFIDAVKAGRGERLVNPDANGLYSGLVWSGEQALELGLIDELGSIYTLKNELGLSTVDYTVQEDPFAELARQLGANFGQGLNSSLQSIGLQ